MTAEVAEVEQVQTPEQIAQTGGDLRRDANVMVEDMLQNLQGIQEKLANATGGQAERLRKEAERLRNSLESARPGVVDLTAYLKKQPSAADIAFTGRAEALIPEARRRMAKSKYMFPEPRAIADAAADLHGSAEDSHELRVRLLHGLAKLNMQQDGLAAATAGRRLLQAAAHGKLLASGVTLTAPQTELLASAKAAVGSFLYEARRRGRQ